MISYPALVGVVQYGRIGIVRDTINTAGVQNAAGPAPKWQLPSSSPIIAHTSVMSYLEVDKKSYAFAARRYHANLSPSNRDAPNWNARGALNA